MIKFVNLIIGGAAGASARYLLSGAVYRLAGTGFPYGTLAVNSAGCFILGFLATLAEKKFILGPQARLLLMVGFCGAFTTFSTSSLSLTVLPGRGNGCALFPIFW
ncbi:MAG: fluoride efflux transporter CrcB [Candidatus Omnitrophota bacterium]